MNPLATFPNAEGYEYKIKKAPGYLQGGILAIGYNTGDIGYNNAQ